MDVHEGTFQFLFLFGYISDFISRTGKLFCSSNRAPEAQCGGPPTDDRWGAPVRSTLKGSPVRIHQIDRSTSKPRPEFPITPFPVPFHSPAAAWLPVAPLSSPESRPLPRRTHSRRESEGGKAPPRGRPRPRRDGVEDGVQGHHHAQGLRRHRQRVLRLRGEQHPVQPRGVPGGDLRQGEKVWPPHAAHTGRGRQDLPHQPHLPALRVAGGWEAAEDRAGHHEQGHRRGARALELQHHHRRRGRRERGGEGEERQGDHEGDPGHHAAGQLLHLLPPLPRRAMHIRRAGLHRLGHHRALHLDGERRQAHRQPADGEAALVRHQDPQGGHAGVLQGGRLGRAVTDLWCDPERPDIPCRREALCVNRSFTSGRRYCCSCSPLPWNFFLPASTKTCTVISQKKKVLLCYPCRFPLTSSEADLPSKPYVSVLSNNYVSVCLIQHVNKKRPSCFSVSQVTTVLDLNGKLTA